MRLLLGGGEAPASPQEGSLSRARSLSRSCSLVCRASLPLARRKDSRRITREALRACLREADQSAHVDERAACAHVARERHVDNRQRPRPHLP